MKAMVLTSNLYVRFLPGFADCWQRYWPGQPATVFCYDVLPPPLPAGFDVVSLGPQDRLSWSAGLIAALDTTRDEVIALFLEDYWLVRPVEASVVQRLERYLLTDETVGKVDLTDDRLKFPHRQLPNTRLAVIHAEPHAPFLQSYQAALWRRSFLRANLRSTEDAWESERNGSERLLGREDVQILGTAHPPVVYAQVAKARKPDLLRHEKLPAAEFERLWQAGHLRSWGFLPDGEVSDG